MDKAPDAFRTISEVADELDIPQHVLRFWETRFTQIKPMKRSGGRRFYRPDDVDLLRGIRRLLYADGYTIRGVQRILKEQGVKAVQGLDMSPRAVPPVEAEAPRAAGASVARRTPLPELEDEPDEAELEIETEAGDEPEIADVDDTSIVVRPPLPKPFTTPLPSLELRRSSQTGMVPRAAAQQDLVPLRTVPPATHTPPAYLPDVTFETLMPTRRVAPRQELEQRVIAELPKAAAPFDVKRLRPVLDELMAVRRLLDVAMQNGEPGAP